MPFVIRASSTSTWPDCPRRGAARIFPAVVRDAGFELRETLQTIGASIGTATHAAVAHTMSEKARTGELANELETEECGVEALEQAVDNGVRWDQTSPNFNTAEKQVVRQYRTYRLHLADHVRPQAVERRITLTTKRGNTLSGAVDLTDEGGLRDLKTGMSRRVNISQYGVYSLLRRSEGGTVARLTEDYIKRVAIDKEQPAPVSIAYDREYAEEVAVRVIAEIEEREAEFECSGNPLVFLANPASQLCSERYCGAFHTKFCPESMVKE